jgi:hypothetical protein
VKRDCGLPGCPGNCADGVGRRVLIRPVFTQLQRHLLDQLLHLAQCRRQRRPPWPDPRPAPQVERARRRQPCSLSVPSWSTTVRAAGPLQSESVHFFLGMTAIKQCEFRGYSCFIFPRLYIALPMLCRHRDGRRVSLTRFIKPETIPETSWRPILVQSKWRANY